ncbi:hypothetical protein AMTR_s00147p00034940 [Amborella trichopoda]|uniref:Uncharacterized protein n=1 Tax=Amborella trichopoda TaxID=13333 RepID=W1P3B8_AMBTC|nr:hypothetical protein AMTR_s00147p00034940 [Amborella trichopoda]
MGWLVSPSVSLRIVWKVALEVRAIQFSLALGTYIKVHISLPGRRLRLLEGNLSSSRVFFSPLLFINGVFTNPSFREDALLVSFFFFVRGSSDGLSPRAGGSLTFLLILDLPEGALFVEGLVYLSAQTQPTS